MILNLASILRESARRGPEGTALIEGESSLTYYELHDQAARVAGGLARLGIGRGRHVALILPNVPQFTIAYFACHYLGAPVVPLNIQFTPDEIAYHLADSDAVALIAWEEVAVPARAGFNRCGSCKEFILAKDEAPGGGGGGAPADAASFAALAMEARPVTELPETMPDDSAVVLYTSGTTGRPKGAELTHFNLFYNAEYVGRKLFSLDAGTVALGALPLFHSFGQTVVQNGVLMRGGTVVLLRRFDAGAALDLISRHGVTFFAGVPTMYFALLHQPEASRHDLRRLQHCMSGGAAMPVEVMREFDRKYHVGILEGYGLSETSPVASSNVSDLPRKPGSIGLPLEGVEFKLTDDQGRVITEPFVAGEICIKGHNVMKGYYKRPEATADAVRNGWFHTGDIAHRDADGYYFIVDRKKDMIIRGGLNVYPREVEEVLYAHPAVAEAAVVGVRDERLGEEVKAILALKAGRSATPEEILDYCKERLAPYKCPRFVQLLDVLPKGPTGKILKRELRA